MSEHDDDRQERLRIHRELQLLRAAGWQPKARHGQGGGIARKRKWVAERARKLDQVTRHDRGGDR